MKTIKPSIEWVNEQLLQMQPVPIIITPEEVFGFLSEKMYETFRIKQEIAEKILKKICDGKYFFRRIASTIEEETISSIVYEYDNTANKFIFVNYTKGGDNNMRILRVDENTELQ